MHWDRFFSKYLDFPLLSTIPPTSHTHIINQWIIDTFEYQLNCCKVRNTSSSSKLLKKPNRLSQLTRSILALGRRMVWIPTGSSAIPTVFSWYYSVPPDPPEGTELIHGSRFTAAIMASSVAGDRSVREWTLFISALRGTHHVSQR
jgi:hypothetical protein